MSWGPGRPRRRAPDSLSPRRGRASARALSVGMDAGEVRAPSQRNLLRHVPRAERGPLRSTSSRPTARFAPSSAREAGGCIDVSRTPALREPWKAVTVRRTRGERAITPRRNRVSADASRAEIFAEPSRIDPESSPFRMNPGTPRGSMPCTRRRTRAACTRSTEDNMRMTPRRNSWRRAYWWPGSPRWEPPRAPTADVCAPSSSTASGGTSPP